MGYENKAQSICVNKFQEADLRNVGSKTHFNYRKRLHLPIHPSSLPLIQFMIKGLKINI